MIVGRRERSVFGPESFIEPWPGVVLERANMRGVDLGGPRLLRNENDNQRDVACMPGATLAVVDADIRVAVVPVA